MRLSSPFIFLGLSIIAGCIAIGYNLYLLANPVMIFGTHFAYLALGIVIIMGGWYIYELQKEKEQPQPLDLPRISDMENPNALPAMTPDQLYVMQQLFRNDYQIRVKSLSGGFVNSGVYRVIQELKQGDKLNESGYVVKFLDVKYIRREIDIYERGGLLNRYLLPFTPGKSINIWPSGPELAIAPEIMLGAICYHFTTLERGSQLQTLTQIYKERDFDEIERYLKILFDQRLSAWYRQKLNEQGKSLGGARGEYERLYRNRERIQTSISNLLGVSGQQLPSKEYIDLSFLPETWQREHYNPLYWILNVLEPGQAECLQVESRYSPVHGDLHTGNILVEQGRETHIWLIDFPNAHIGPALVDFATLEADIKFYLLESEHCSWEEWLDFERRLLIPLVEFPRYGLTWPWYTDWKPKGELYKAWQCIGFLRERIGKHQLIGNDIRAYYLALLHATLPIIYRRSPTESQKQRALTSSAWICEYLRT